MKFRQGEKNLPPPKKKKVCIGNTTDSFQTENKSLNLRVPFYNNNVDSVKFPYIINREPLALSVTSPS